MRWSCSLLLMLALCALPASAQEKLDIDQDSPALSRLANTRWSMAFPEYDFEGGCLMGFFAFRFSGTGYFTFDNRVQGQWSIDPQGNVQLKTRRGHRFMLMMEDNELRLVKELRITTSSTAWVFRRNSRFRQCPNE